MSCEVYKFGGGCIGSGARAIENMGRIASFLITKWARTPHGVVVVVSAPAGITDLLEGAAGLNPALQNTPELDELLSLGETISTKLLEAAIKGAGGKAVTVNAYDVIITDDRFGNSTILEVDTLPLQMELNAGNIVIIAGFQGGTYIGRMTTTLGRGGSDTTAVALAGALGAECIICKETNGIHTADPKIIPGAPVVRVMTFRELRESARGGAKVIAASAAELAEKGGVPVRVVPAFEAGEGTLISAKRKSAERTVTTITSANYILARVSLCGNPQVISQILRRLADERVNIEDVAAETGDTTAFTIREKDRRQAEKILCACGSVVRSIAGGLGKVTVVGEGIENTPGVMARVRETLESEGIEIRGITSSDITISCLVKANEIEPAIHALHTEFIET